MANRMSALSEYRPRIEHGEMVDEEMLAQYIARGTAMNPGEIYNVLRELQDAILVFMAKGSPVRLADVGIFRPRIKLDGSYRVSFRMNPTIRRTINLEGYFNGTVSRSQNIGLTMEDLIDMWNEEHPEDPVEENMEEEEFSPEEV